MTQRQRKTRDESRQQTRERLLEAARHLFAQGGYGGASVDSIASEAGYSKGAFYSNFSSKEDIFLELLARHMANEADQLTALLEAATSVEQIFASLDEWLAQLNADADWALLSMELQLHARRSDSFAARYEALFSAHRGRLGDLIARLFRASRKRLPAPATDLAGALMALTHGLVLQRAAAKRGPDPAGKLIKLVLGSVVATSASMD